MRLLEKIIRKIIARKNIDYDLAKKSLKLLYRDAKTLGATIDEFLYAKVFKRHSWETAFATAYDYHCNYHATIHAQWDDVKRDWGYIKKVIRNDFKNNSEGNAKEYCKNDFKNNVKYNLIDYFKNDSRKYPESDLKNEFRQEPVSKSKIAMSIDEYVADTQAGFGKSRPDKQYLCTLINASQQYRGTPLSIVETHLKKKYSLSKTLEETLKEAMQYKVNDAGYSDIPQIRFNKELLNDEMKAYMKRQYINSSDTLKIISTDFEQKYGMHVSESTLSKYTRLYLMQDTKGPAMNRRQAKKVYANQTHKKTQTT